MSAYTISDTAKTFLAQKHQQMLINGKLIAGSNTIAVVNPANEETIAFVPNADDQTVDEAVSSAYDAFHNGKWKQLLPDKRESLLHRLADLLEAETDTIAEILTLESGKLIAQSKSEIAGAVATFRYYAGWPTKIEGETIDISLKQKPGKENFTFTKREAVGVVAAIVPWNFPISIASWKLAPALAAGCTVVLKPSEVTPLSSLYFAGLFKKAGFSPGVVNLITGDGNTGAALTRHPKVSKITFTGSTRVGQLIGKSAMDNMTGISLELGGKSPALIFEDCDMEEAAKGTAMGIFRNSGQVCVAGSRVYIQRSIFESMVEAISVEAKKMKISDGFDPDAELGPLVSEAHWTRVNNYIQTGINSGAKLCCGGNNPKDIGFYIEPTIFRIENNDHPLVQEEIFGPVLVAIPFDTMEEALALANDSRYGLSSTIWTQDISKAMHCVKALDAGWVFVNSVARSDPHFPLGGNKMSGNTRELGKAGVYNYTKIKAVNIVY